MSIGKTKRFEVFDRDNFTCRYCGRSVDDGITLEVDHIHPKSKGGSDDVANLATSCFDCNRGKSDKDIGGCAPETDSQRMKRLQELRELERASAELIAVTAETTKLRGAWTDAICKMADVDEVDSAFVDVAMKLHREFGPVVVSGWVNRVISKFGLFTPYDRTRAAKYLNGIARKVREEIQP